MDDQTTTLRPDQPDDDGESLTRDGRIDFVTGCAATALIFTPIAYCFLYYQLTGTKSGFAPAALVTGFVTTGVTLWAALAKPARWLLTFIGLIVPTVITIGILWRRAYLLFG